MFANKKRAGINTFLCAFSLDVAETSNASIKDHEPTLSIISSGIVAYGFVGQAFSKQLYVHLPREFHNNSLCKILGANRVHCGQLENREFLIGRW